MIIILITKDDITLLFTSDKELQQAVAKLAYLLGITTVLNSVQPIISGVAIGGGWQGMVAYINLGCYYLFKLPLGCVLCHVANLGVMVEQATNRVRKWGGKDIRTVNGAEST
ncbi:protein DETOXIFICATION 35-like [Pyrus x bretschneideri]|uniref:protein DETOXIFICATION 35-like n=1 Tax=Pyrus x bretschneideri TaxID=225117 RepID=UPI002030429F|nr:protein DETOXIFICATION 35-like [Pyrus x bretschneideri]